jgi:FkbM family methyltransferase
MAELITIKDRIRFALLPKKQYLGYQAKRASRRGERELEMLKFVVPRGRNAIDGGAHKGVYSWYLSKLCGEIYAFEPNPTMFAYLRQAVPRNVKCFQAALSDATGKAVFNLPTSRGHFHHTQGSLLKVTGSTGHEELEVEVHTIDQHDFENVGFIKLDLEGAEQAALEGATQLLRRDRPVVLAEATGVGGSSPRELTQLMVNQGYVPLVYSDHRLRYFGKESGERITHNCFYFPEEDLP